MIITSAFGFLSDFQLGFNQVSDFSTLFKISCLSSRDDQPIFTPQSNQSLSILKSLGFTLKIYTIFALLSFRLNETSGIYIHRRSFGFLSDKNSHHFSSSITKHIFHHWSGGFCG